MRPDYVQAIESARFGLLLYATIAMPFAIIIAAFAINRFLIKKLSTSNRTLFLVAMTVLAYVIFVLIAAVYLGNIQAVKMHNMVTDVEIADASSDGPFDLLIALAAGVLYCGFTFVIGLAGTAISRIRSASAKQDGSDDDQLLEDDDNPYRSPSMKTRTTN